MKKIVSPMAIVTAVLLAVLLVGCSGGPGQAPDEEVPPEEMPATPPTVQEFSGTFTAMPATLTTGTITATISGISHDGTPLMDPVLAAAIAQIGGAEQTLDYSFAPGPTMTTITLTGDLLTALMLPDGMVSAIRSGPPVTDPATALNGTWSASVTDPQTMATINLMLVISAPNFTLTMAPAVPASS